MKIREFCELILQRFGFPPTEDQKNALDCFGHFLASRHDMPVMILKGSAGTGKTSIVAAMVQTLVSLRQRVVLMAPTGRAAKVISLNAGLPASTIHRKIYRQKTFQGDFNLNFNNHSDTLFVVDEASMISSIPTGETGFGTGSLLDDLMQYVFSGENCRLMLIGDTAQLPPVGEDESPALLSDVIEGYGAQVVECKLEEVLRQSAESGILYNATMIRRLIQYDEATELPKITFSKFPDIHIMPGNEIIDSLSMSYRDVGYDETIVITRSNKNATLYNNGIRNQVLDRDSLLCQGDNLMIVRNNYFYRADKTSENGNKETGTGKGGMFIANGDRATVVRIRKQHELYGFHFAEVLLRFPDYDDLELETMLLTDTLQSDSPSLTQTQYQALFSAIEEDYMDIHLKADRIKAVRNDPFFNALQVKYAYAVTCHKAQGGQWANVYIDQGYMTDDMLTPDYIHWLYTAFTRATEHLYLVNWPKTQIMFNS